MNIAKLTRQNFLKKNSSGLIDHTNIDIKAKARDIRKTYLEFASKKNKL